MFGDLELMLAANPRASSRLLADADEPEHIPPLIEFDGDGTAGPAGALGETKQSVPHSALVALTFYSTAKITLLGGEGESVTLNRLRDLSDDHCLIFKQDDGTRLRFRVEDFSVDERGLDWVHGSYMYTVTQLPAGTATKLPDTFDRSAELVESANRVMEPLAEALAISRVVSTATRDQTAGGSEAAASTAAAVCHQATWFVDDIQPNGRDWVLLSTKRRDELTPSITAGRPSRRCARA